MNAVTRPSPRRAAHWPEVERFFGQLPPELFQQGVLLRHDLAQAYSDAGQFQSILSRPIDPPWLDLAFWLLDDWGVPADAARARLERGVFAATLFLVGAAYVEAGVRDEAHTFDGRYHGLAQALRDEARTCLLRLFPETSPFWDHFQRYLESQTADARIDWAALSEEEAHRRLRARFALGHIPIAALAFAQRAALADLERVTDDLHLHLALLHDVLNLKRDAHSRHQSYSIARIRRAANLGGEPPPPPEQILGAALLTGTVRAIADECGERLGTTIERARTLGLPTLAAYAQELQAQLAELQALFSLRASEPTASALRFTAPRRPLDEALAMAEAYLFADRTFRESWEVQRRGVLGEAALTGRAFGPGLVLEALRPYHDIADDISAWLAALARDGFRYYPHPSVPPDADDIGLALRLLPHSANPSAQRQLLERPLRWLRANLAEDGRIPCWFVREVEGLDTHNPLALWGDHCATVEANALLGLLTFDADAHRDLITRAATRWLARWRTVGLGANALYAPACALWTAARLLEALASSGLVTVAANDLAPAIDRLSVEAEHVTSAQSAACLTLACRHPDLAARFSRGWVTLILKQQRYDGSWPGEPLFVTPTRGELAAWYSSATVTTAYCYQALRIAAAR